MAPPEINDRDQYERVCKAAFDCILAKLQRIDEAIRGNGKPGIMIRLDRLEGAATARNRVLWLIGVSLVGLAVTAVWRLIAGGT